MDKDTYICEKCAHYDGRFCILHSEYGEVCDRDKCDNYVGMKIWKIKCCKECPNVDYTFKMVGTKHNYIICTVMENKEMDNDNKLPDWCPLPEHGGEIKNEKRNLYKNRRNKKKDKQITYGTSSFRKDIKNIKD